MSTPMSTPMHTLAQAPAAVLATPTQPVLHDSERQRCEVWTRVMGYHRPVASFNVGKQGEFAERRHFSEPCGQHR